MALNTYALIYTSVAKVRFSRENLTKLMEQSRRYNSENGITGLLAYANGHWMEVLEGDRKAVEELMIRIARDPRHGEIEVIEKGEAPAREFSNWSMAFLDFLSPEVRALPGYSTFLETPFDWQTQGEVGPGLQMLNYFKAIMLASDDSILNLVQAAEIERRAPVLAGKVAAARRRS